MLPTQAGSDGRPPLPGQACSAQASAGLEMGGGVRGYPRSAFSPPRSPAPPGVQGGRSHLIGSCSHPGTCPGTSCPPWRLPECRSPELNNNRVGVKGEQAGGDTVGRGMCGRLAAQGAGVVGPFITAYLPLFLGPLCPGPARLGSPSTGK